MCIRDRNCLFDYLRGVIMGKEKAIIVFNNIKLNTSVAVSYTHLDVYKRQIYP